MSAEPQSRQAASRSTRPLGWHAPRAIGVRILVGLLALGAILTALLQLHGASAGLSIQHSHSAGVPLTLYRPAGTDPAPAVVIAHGFAGSRQMMDAYAISLARNGYLVVTFDFPGHGGHRQPFVARLDDQERRSRLLGEALEQAAAFALSQPSSDGRLALVGHSMAGDPLVRYAQAHRDTVAATVLLSPYLAPETRIDEARNLLLIYGALEPEMLHQDGRERLSPRQEEASADLLPRGDLAQGDARDLRLIDGVEHIGVLFSTAAVAVARDWLDQSFAHSGSGFVAQRGPWLALLYAGLLGLAWPLAALLPRLADPPRGAGLGWRRLWPIALAPALLTPVLLWPLPSGWLPVLLADYLTLHFALYGLLTLLGLWLVGRRQPRAAHPPLRWSGFVLATLGAFLYAGLLFLAITDRFVTALWPDPQRLGILALVALGTLLYFLADAWLTRGPGAARGAAVATKALFLFSLLLAVALNLSTLFFLVIIVPAILLLFLVYGLMGGWIDRATGHPLVSATVTALTFACAMTMAFPLAAP